MSLSEAACVSGDFVCFVIETFQLRIVWRLWQTKICSEMLKTKTVSSLSCAVGVRRATGFPKQRAVPLTAVPQKPWDHDAVQWLRGVFNWTIHLNRQEDHPVTGKLWKTCSVWTGFLYKCQWLQIHQFYTFRAACYNTVSQLNFCLNQEIQCHLVLFWWYSYCKCFQTTTIKYKIYSWWLQQWLCKI